MAAPPLPRRQTGLPVGFEALLADSLADGWRLLQVFWEDWQAGRLRFEGPGESLFACHAGDRLLAVCGCSHDPYARSPGTGRVRRLYVRREARGHGLGRALLRAVAEAAIPEFSMLHVRAPASAWAFYQRCGFLRAVGEPSATHRLPLPVTG
jgi:GNAT superfamily N-acetyltransferase